MNPGTPKPILGIVFDMDGLLIDSEPIWQDSEIQVFGRHGLKLSRSDCMQTMGLRIDEVVEYWRGQAASFNPDMSNDLLVTEVLKEVRLRIENFGQPMPGAVELLNRLSDSIPLALASSSYPEIIDAALNRLGIKDLFSVIHSAQMEKRGKPAPDVYLTACKKLELKTENCLAIEDSPGGVRSALAAGMTVIAVPDDSHKNHPEIQKAHLRLNSLTEFRWDADQLKQGQWGANA